MQAQLGYDRAMRYWAPVLALSMIVVVGVSAFAQSNGVPPSVTSYGFGGHPGFGGVPPSVTSVGPNGPSRVASPVRPVPVHPGPMRPGPAHHPGFNASGDNHHRHDRTQTVVYPYFVPYYPVVDPYAYGGPDVEQSAAAAGEGFEDDQYQGGPTIFDRRGTGTAYPNDHVTQDANAPVAKPDPVPDPPPATAATAAPDPITLPPAASQPKTILIFKDGHTQEVSNYAIVGKNLFDLTPGRRQKIALDDLDLAATQKANEDQGIEFKLPELPSGA